jgi:uncharacterized protein (DUF2141 family)
MPHSSRSQSESEIDLNLVECPAEVHGFSDDATGRMGPPSLEEAAFEHRSERRITISVR